MKIHARADICVLQLRSRTDGEGAEGIVFGSITDSDVPQEVRSSQWRHYK